MIPEHFKPYRQFINWSPVWNAEKGKHEKITGQSVTDRTAWLSWEEAISRGSNVGFVFTSFDPFFFLDIDNALSADGRWSDLAMTLCQAFTGCYIEVSQSGKGLHIFGTGIYPTNHSCRNTALNIEFYTRERFVALTGTNAVGSAIHCNQSSIDWLVHTYFKPRVNVDTGNWTTTAVPEYSGPDSDTELIELMLKSKKSPFSRSASVHELWHGDTSKYGGDHSSADAALCQHLAFWTGKNCERIDQLFRQSGLFREKWENRQDYRQSTILKAVQLCSATYSKTSMRDGLQFLSIEQQLQFFQGCTYIRNKHRVSVPDGGLLTPDQFRVVYGGYIFAIDNLGDKTTRNAWDAFTQSQGYKTPMVNQTCFRPELPPMSIVDEENTTMLNTYTPVNVVMRQGDVTPFLRHMSSLLPDDNDRLILLSYMAACVQHVGVKFQWAPLLQGIEGNGKTFAANCIAYAVGHRYTHVPDANDLSNRFNAWIENRLFIIIEEIYVRGRFDLINTLKPMITNRRIGMQAKGLDQFTGDNRANFFLCSNHKDAIVKTQKDRRYCVFYTAQQVPSDLVKLGWINPDGRPNGYFPELYRWANNGGYAAVAYYLATMQIPDIYNPADMCHRAPITSSTEESIHIGLSGLHQDIQEAVGEGRQGFCAPWISSMALSRMLTGYKKISPTRRREVLEDLGYIPHPGLPNGRVNKTIPGEGGKPRLYVLSTSQECHLVGHNEIIESYLTAQNPFAA